MNSIKLFLITFFSWCVIGFCNAETIIASESQVTKDFSISDFSGFTVANIISVEYTYGKPSAKAVGPDNLIKFLIIEQVGNSLRIDFSKESNFKYKNKQNITVYLSSPHISDVKLIGTGNITFRSDIKENDFSCNLIGTGDIIIPKVSCSNCFTAILNGTGDIDIANVKSSKSSLKLLGTGDIKVENLASDYATVILNGTGDLMPKILNAPNSEIILNGTGNIKASSISGNKTSVKLNGTGNISIQKCDYKDVITTLTGTGDINVSNIQAESLNSRISGLGKTTLSGYANEANLKVTYSVIINAENLKAQNVYASAGGRGTIKCYAEKKLNATVIDSGKILYLGNPQVVTTESESVVKL